MSSLKDTDHLTPEHNWSAMHPTYEACLRATISPVYATVPGTESHERAVFFAEIDRLRAEVAELAQQRGDLAANVLELKKLLLGTLDDSAKLTSVLKAAVELACSSSWVPHSNEAMALQQVLRDCGFIVASESQPSEMRG